MATRVPNRTSSPGGPRRGGTRSRSFQPSQKNLWKSVKTRRERSPNFRQKQSSTVISRYKIEDTIVGKGASSVVKPALDLISGYEYVSKIIQKDDVHHAKDEDVMQEVAILEHLPKHKNIVEFIELLDQPFEYLVILESLSNGDLCDAILECTDNRIPEDRARSYFIMMTEALVCCHENGVSHRDVKPENMLLSDKYELKLTDFGLARRHKGSFRCQPDEMTTELVGTLRYAAPELFRGHFDGVEYDDFISDIWSLGVCLYVMLAGVFPFSTGNMSEEGIRDLLYSNEGIEMPTNCTPEAVELLTKLLKVDPEERIHIRDILNDPWCKSTATKADAMFDDMEREELIQYAKRQRDMNAENEKTVSRLRNLLSEMEGKLEDLQKENHGLAQRAVEHGPLSKRSVTPSSAVRNVVPASASARGKTSNSPIVSRKYPTKSPGTVSHLRSTDSSNYGSPVTVGPGGHPAKPRTLSPRPLAKPSAKGAIGKILRPDSPGKAAKPATSAAGRATARGSPGPRSSSNGLGSQGSVRSTPPKKPGTNRRLTTASPSRTPPAPARASGIHALVSSASPSTVRAGYLSSSSPAAPVASTSNGTGQSTSNTPSTKPFNIGDTIVYTNKADSTQCEGSVRFYGRVEQEEGRGYMLGIEVTKNLKGDQRFLHDGMGYFSCPQASGLLVPPKDCRLVQAAG